jgi:hypothetical protein
MEQTHPATRVRRKKNKKKGDERTQALCSYAEFAPKNPREHSTKSENNGAHTHDMHTRPSRILIVL